MKTTRRIATAALAIAALATAAPIAADEHKKTEDIVDTAVAAGSFTTLAAALEATGLVETLKGDGPFTVFAPTDDAFAKLPDGTVEALLQDTEKLSAILTYHVVSGQVDASQVVDLTSAETVNGENLAIMVKDGMVHVGEAMVVQADVMASNGVIHIIDTVLLPQGN